jgi:ABC-type phosphate/phosphonate transport system substrate-binding protein
MKSILRSGVFFALALALLAAARAGDDREPASNRAPIRIAVAESFFRDIPEPLVRPLVEPLRILMVSQTGMDGEVILPKGTMPLARDLAEEKLQLALFHGFEFAWAKHKYPELQPLVIALHRQRELKVYLMVRADSPIRSYPDFQGKPVSLPCYCQEHCWVYMERACRDAGQNDPKKFFSPLTHPANAEVGLDELADGKVQAAIVDNIALEAYKERKPARAAKLKIVQESESFPAAVIAYRPGSLDSATVKLFQNSLLEGQKTSVGRQLLTLWKLNTIERVPDGFNESLAKILKAYPPPKEQAKGKEKEAITRSGGSGRP